MLAEAQRRADAFAERYAGQRRRARRRPASSRRCTSSASSQEIVGRAGSYARLHFSTDTADPARGALLPARAGEGDARSRPKLLFFELEWAALDDERADELLATDGPRLLPPPPAHRAPLPPAPALRARGEDPRREGADRPQRVGAAVRGADRRRSQVDMRGRRRAGLARGRALAAALRPTATVRARRRRARDRRAGARPAHARLRRSTRCWPTRWSTTGCAATRTGWRAATSPTRRPTSRSQALVDGRPQPLRAAAPLVPPEGAAARARPARRLRPHGRGHAGEPDRRRGARRATSCRTPTRRFSPELGDLVHRFFDERWIDAPVRPGKRGGAFCAYTRAVACTRT